MKIKEVTLRMFSPCDGTQTEAYVTAICLVVFLHRSVSFSLHREPRAKAHVTAIFLKLEGFLILYSLCPFLADLAYLNDSLTSSPSSSGRGEFLPSPKGRRVGDEGLSRRVELVKTLLKCLPRCLSKPCRRDEDARRIVLKRTADICPIGSVIFILAPCLTVVIIQRMLRYLSLLSHTLGILRRARLGQAGRDGRDLRRTYSSVRRQMLERLESALMR